MNRSSSGGGAILRWVALLALALGAVHCPRLLSDQCCSYVSYDDPANFQHNPYINQLTVSNVHWALTDGVILGVWEPASLIFRMGYRTLLGESAWVCLVVSVALHTTNICAVFVLIALQYGKGRRWMACCASSALVIALHPLCVEATCWASAQGYPLAGLFSVCAVAAQLPLADTLAGEPSPAVAPHYRRAMVCGFYACAVLAKPAALPVPALLLALEYRSNLQLIARRSQDHAEQGRKQNNAGIRAAAATVRANVGLVLLAAILVFVVIRATPDLQQEHTRRQPRTEIDLAERLARTGAALSHQLSNTIGLGCLEQPLSVRYRWQHTMNSGLAYFGAAALVTAGAACLVVVWPVHTSKTLIAVGLCWLCYVALLLPTTGLVVQHGVPMLTADRYSYLPLLLLGTPALAHMLHSAVNTLGSHTFVDISLCVVVVAVVAVEAQATVGYSAVWVNSTSLWQYVVNSDPRDAPALSELAGAALETLRPRNDIHSMDTREAVLEQALGWYDKAVALETVQARSAFSSLMAATRTYNAGDRRFGDIWSNRGLVLGALGGGRLLEALSSFEHAATVYSGPDGIGFSSTLAEAACFTNWGAVLAGMARHKEAVVVLQQSVELNPIDASVHLRLATELKAIAAYDEEIQAYDAALAIMSAQHCSETPPAHAFFTRADENIDAENGRCGSVMDRHHFANGAGRSDVIAQAALVALLPRAGTSGSTSTVKHIAQLNRCVALERLEKNSMALDCYDDLLASIPDYSRALANRATVLYSLGRASEAVQGYGNALGAAAGGDEVSALTRASWLNNRGFVLGTLATGDGVVALQREHEAMVNFRAAIALEAESGLPSDGKATANLAKLENRRRDREMQTRISAARTAGATTDAGLVGVDAATGRPLIIKRANDLINLAQQQLE